MKEQVNEFKENIKRFAKEQKDNPNCLGVFLEGENLMKEENEETRSKELTESQKMYFKSRIDFKSYRYWTGGILLRTKRVILEALRIGCVVSVKSKTNSLYYTFEKNDAETLKIDNKETKKVFYKLYQVDKYTTHGTAFYLGSFDTKEKAVEFAQTLKVNYFVIEKITKDEFGNDISNELI